MEHRSSNTKFGQQRWNNGVSLTRERNQNVIGGQFWV